MVLEPFCFSNYLKHLQSNSAQLLLCRAYLYSNRAQHSLIPNQIQIMYIWCVYRGYSIAIAAAVPLSIHYKYSSALIDFSIRFFICYFLCLPFALSCSLAVFAFGMNEHHFYKCLRNMFMRLYDLHMESRKFADSTSLANHS